ncbi:MAG TPA: diacylglycerol kinase family protein [Rectinemataceae bacterium]|nr:diacylglycerol kinase family protein [Rectinemataceae bacterium]
MTSGKTLLVLNPTAGKGRAGMHRLEIEAALARHGLVFDTVLTTGPWHAAELARGASLAGYALLVAAGGDGTLNEVINGLMLCKQDGGRPPALGVLPVGRGNDLAYGMGVPMELQEAALAIASKPSAPFDVGFVRGGDYPEGRWFGNGVGIGFDARVGFAAAGFRHLHSSLTYTVGALKVFALFPEAPEVTIRSATLTYEGPCHQISIMNGSRMGGSYYMAPDAKVDDGHLDLCIVGKMSRLEMAGIIIRYTKGSQKGHPKVRMELATAVSIEAPNGGLAVHADGETICENGKHIQIECVAGALEAHGLGHRGLKDGDVDRSGSTR